MKNILLVMVITVLTVPASGAEFLIYNKDHWMHKLTSEQLKVYTDKYENFQAKVDGQYVKGDVIEVRPDGFYTNGRGFNKTAFRVLSVPGLSVKDAMAYKEVTLTKKSRFNIPTGEGKDIETVTNIQNVSITDKELISAKPSKILFAVMLMLHVMG